MKYTFNFTSFDWSIFVIWRIVNNEQKKRVVIDIRKLNKIIVIDFYFLSLQIDITSLIIDCIHFIVIDAIKFFHQWKMQANDKCKFIVISHRRQEQFNVVSMKFKNSFSYVQRQINAMLRLYRDFVRAYINNLSIFNKFFDDYIKHLHAIFKLLND